MACHQAARAAVQLGYKNVFIMPAGIAGWEKAKKPVEKGVS
jgi:rhodanese-related sulfurtransferase